MNYAHTFIAVCFFALGVLVRDVGQDYRDAHALPASLGCVHPRRAEIAPIEPRCGRQWIARQADGKRWRVHCYGPKVRT